METKKIATYSTLILMGLSLTNCGPMGATSENLATQNGAKTSSSFSSPSAPGSSPLASTTSSNHDDEKSPTPENCSYWSSRKQKIQQALAALSQSDEKYNQLADAIAFAGRAPAGYISPNVSPSITQGPGVTDSLHRITILRADLYYAHDVTADVRSQLKSGSTSPQLPSTLTGVASVSEALGNYVTAYLALPKFEGPPGYFQGEAPGTTRAMNMLDCNAIQSQLPAYDSLLAGCP